ncbi:YaaC family protein [Tessaracoccus antarcticus]|nr:YaaC family protein [Tessaracoccus antarcticus]
MPTTYYEMGLMTAAESWRAIRTLRAEPHESLDHVLGTESARRREFHMALEQAQQQFAAAERIGYESRPLNLFYGLSQAGRAIAAGSHALGGNTGRQWQAMGHGLKYDVAIPRGVWGTPIRQDGGSRSLFATVSLVVDSPLDFKEVQFGAAVNQLLDYTMAFREPEEYARPITDVSVSIGNSLSFPVEIPVPMPWLEAGQPTPPADLRKFVAQYPALQELEIAVDADGNDRWNPTDGYFVALVNSPEQLKISRTGVRHYLEDDPRQPRHLQRTSYYRRVPVLLPRAGESAASLHPLMSWWTVLFALSMLARYAPSKWTETLALSEHRYASRIEFLLDSALDAVPELLWQALSEINEGSL